MRGLIPAYAGRTRFLSAHVTPATAHPRLRGADHRILRGMHRGLGSSPLTRGGHGSKPTREPPSGLIPAYAGRTHALALIPSTWRLIPAYAGRTRWGMSLGLLIWAHPRLRGADGADVVPGIPVVGSSPLTRGGPVADSLALCGGGLIPAYAGRTSFVISILCNPGAHPRLRGADDPHSVIKVAAVGSSPLTRGGPAGDRLFHPFDGLIPAYAGRT